MALRRRTLYKGRMMDYERRFEDAINRLKAEERYRIFANLERDASRFPMAMRARPERSIALAKSPSGARTIISAWAATRM